MVRKLPHILCRQLRIGANAVAHDGAKSVLRHGFCPAIVHIHNAPVTVAEQKSLCRCVFGHRLVEIQMIFCEIRKGTHSELHTAHPFQHQGMGGYLHDHMGTAGIAHLREKLLQLKALRGGALGMEHLLPDHILDRSDEAYLGPNGLLQHAFQKIGGSGLAVGSGDADDLHGIRRVAKPVGSKLRQRQTGRIHLHIAAGDLRCALTKHHSRTLLQCCRDEPVPIHSKAGNGHKQLPRTALAGIIAHTCDLSIQVRIKSSNLNALQ